MPLTEPSAISVFLDLFHADSAGLAWAHNRAEHPDAPDYVRAFAAGGPATPEVWEWLAKVRRSQQSTRTKPHPLTMSYKSDPRTDGNVRAF